MAMQICLKLALIILFTTVITLDIKPAAQLFPWTSSSHLISPINNYSDEFLHDSECLSNMNKSLLQRKMYKQAKPN